MSDTKIRILHFGPNDKQEGIAKYQHQYSDAMAESAKVENTFFGVSSLDFRNLNPTEQQAVLGRLQTMLRDFDILHLQHEFGLFADTEFQRLVAIGKASGKKIVVTVHLSPAFAIKSVRLGGLGPHSMVAYLRELRHKNKMTERHITPFLQADRLIVHNYMTVDALKAVGADPEKIIRIPHPVQQFPEPPNTTLITDKLHRKKGDVIYCVSGYIYKVKGMFAAVKALKYLPDNYKLAIIGGVHPLSNEIELYDKLTDLIDELDLKDRVYITGFVEDDNLLNAYIRECDVTVYPYDRVYYAHLSSGALNLGFANAKPIIAYPTEGFKEVASEADGALILCETFAYYELARELQRIDIPKQIERSKAYAKKMAWPKLAKNLIQVYEDLAG
jgi:glycosyltransferase involved in cell wall biosynthesis